MPLRLTIVIGVLCVTVAFPSKTDATAENMPLD
jgi:hypothetical protein